MRAVRYITLEPLYTTRRVSREMYTREMIETDRNRHGHHSGIVSRQQYYYCACRARVYLLRDDDVSIMYV